MFYAVVQWIVLFSGIMTPGWIFVMWLKDVSEMFSTSGAEYTLLFIILLFALAAAFMLPQLTDYQPKRRIYAKQLFALAEKLKQTKREDGNKDLADVRIGIETLARMLCKNNRDFEAAARYHAQLDAESKRQK